MHALKFEVQSVTAGVTDTDKFLGFISIYS